MNSVGLPVALIEIAQEQHGLVSRHQCERAGYPTSVLGRMVIEGQAVALTASVYLVGTGTLVSQPLAELLEMVPDASLDDLTRDGHVVASHETAAYAFGWEGTPSRWTFSTDLAESSSSRELRIVRSAVPASDRTVVDGLPVTTPARTLHDLATDAIDLADLSRVVDLALEDDAISPDGVRRALAPVAARHGLGADTDVIDFVRSAGGA